MKQFIERCEHLDGLLVVSFQVVGNGIADPIDKHSLFVLEQFQTRIAVPVQVSYLNLQNGQISKNL